MGASSLSNVLNRKSQTSLKKLLSYPLVALLSILLVIHFYYKSVDYYSVDIKSPFSVAPTDREVSTKISPLSPPPEQEVSTKISPPPPPPPEQEVSRKISVSQTLCNYSQGKWVPTEVEPLYNGTTCATIKPGQNCGLYGRPDRGYLHWRWKPLECDLPRFDPEALLQLLRNKHIAFVGDSLARNQLESLLCMMATVSKPNLYYTGGPDNRFRKWHIPSYNVNVSIYWSPFLVKGVEKTLEKNFNVQYLDKVDERWAADLGAIDVLVLTIGQWYLLPTVYQDGDTVLGCHIVENCTEIGFYDVYGKALKTALQQVITRKQGFPLGRGVGYVLLVTFPPAHFEGDWDKLGSCSKTKPYRPGEAVVEGMNAEMRRIALEQLEAAKSRARELGGRVKLEALDVTELAMMRPDGHPGPYMNPFPFANGIKDRVQNDCVHWCLPGAIDTWNEILLDLIKRLGDRLGHG